MILFPLVVAVAAFCVECPLTWGGREAHPAIVNPVLAQENVISLRGEWEFSVPERDLPNRNGIWGNFNQKQKWGESRKIRVPGCWEAQGVGEPGMSEPWDATWDHCGKSIRHKYMGEGWYRKENEIFVLYTHNVRTDGKGDSHDIALGQLDRFLSEAERLGVKVIGLDELA